MNAATATPSSRELRSRAPVWDALSDFWLDTELVDHDFVYIARVISASPYSIDEVRAIHDYEVAPALWRNLASVAGEWAGFNSERLNARCLERASRRQSRLFRLRIWWRRPMFRRFTDRYWRQVVPRVNALRTG
jgi:hypothetical protein